MSDARKRARAGSLRLWVSSLAVAMVVTAATPATAAVRPGPARFGPVPAVDTNPDPGVFETTIVAQEAVVDMGHGILKRANTYGGTVPGPEIRVKVGDRVIVHFENELPLPSGIHWHGIELNNASDGTGVTQNQVLTGGTFTYDFIVPREGVFWYHPHFDPTNAEFRGQYGSLIVEGPISHQAVRSGRLPGPKATYSLVMADTTVCREPGQNDAETFPPGTAPDDPPWAGGGIFPGNSSPPTPDSLCENALSDTGLPTGLALDAGEVPNIQPAETCPPMSGACRVNEGQLVKVNGRLPAARTGSPDAPGAVGPGAEYVDVVGGQGVRLQMINASVTRYFRLRLTDATGRQLFLFRVGGEGGLLDRVRLEGGVQGTLDMRYEAGEILMGPGNRADVVFVVPGGQAGTVLTLWTLDFDRTGGGFARLPTVPVAHFRVSGDRATRFAIGVGDRLRAPGSEIESLKELTGVPLTDPPGGTGTTHETVVMSNVELDGFRALALHHGTDDFVSIPFFPSSRFARSGDVLFLEFENTTNAHHPMHQHGFSFQPIRLLDGATTVVEFDYNEFLDTFDVPAGLTLQFVIRLDPRPAKGQPGGTEGGEVGRWVLHCHIFHHAALGMIAELVVLPGPSTTALAEGTGGLQSTLGRHTPAEAGQHQH